MNYLLFAGMPPSEFEYFVALALLVVLNVMKRGRSLLGHGAFAGLLLGYLAFEWQSRELGWSRYYFRRIEYVQTGLFIGLLIGGAIRFCLIICMRPKPGENGELADKAPPPSPFFWSAAFAITGVYLSLFVIVFFEIYFFAAMNLLMGVILAGSMAGLFCGPLLVTHQKIAKSLEVAMGIFLLVGIGFLFYWKAF